jgi:hypothetical protein
MPHTMRVEYPGAICHVMDRGDRREDIFVDDVDRQDEAALPPGGVTAVLVSGKNDR